MIEVFSMKKKVADVVVDVENKDIKSYCKRDNRNSKMKIINTKTVILKSEFETILQRAKVI